MRSFGEIGEEEKKRCKFGSVLDLLLIFEVENKARPAGPSSQIQGLKQDDDLVLRET